MASENNGDWGGWVLFASIMMVILGLFQAIAGLAALINNEHVLITNTGVYLFDLTTWGWVHLILGTIVVSAGLAVARGEIWGRVIGVILASLSAIANLAFISTNPIWTLLVIVINMVVIYALIVHGREVRAQS